MMDENRLLDIVAKYGSPLYVFDIEYLRKRLALVKQILGELIDLCFAMKANPFLIAYADPLIDKFEVCSPGEYEICKKEQIRTEKIVMSGVYKSSDDMAVSFSDGFHGIYTVESPAQYRSIAQLAKTNQQPVRLLFRLTSGNQFGLDQDDMIALLQECKQEEYLNIVGIHYFSGTQKRKAGQFQQELQQLDSFCAQLNDICQLEIKDIEYGPGLSYNYFNKAGDEHQELYLLKDALQPYLSRYHFTIELGRYLSASCGRYLTTVVDVKRNKNVNYCIVDGGIHHLNYFGQLLGAKVPSVHVLRRAAAGHDVQKWMVCGALCTIHDILLKNFETGGLCTGDIFVFDDAGAYSITETCGLFLSRDLPKVLALDKGTAVLREKMSTYQLNSRVLD